jgi:hypothetical protein
VPPNLVNGTDIGVVQSRRRTGLTAEAFKRLRIACQFLRKKLQRYKAAEMGIFGLVDHTHPSASKPFGDPIV